MRQTQIYRYVITIARLGSIRQAAEILAISPSALNRQILSFEHELGARLFDRVSSGVRLSAAGELYLKLFKDHLSAMEDVARRVDDLSGLRRGDIRIGAGPELQSTFMAQQVALYQAQYPLLNFTIMPVGFNDMAKHLLDREIDAGMAIGAELGLGISEMFSEDVSVSGILMAGQSRRKMLTFSDLAQAPLIVPTRQSGLRNLIDAAFLGRKIHPHYVLEYDGAVEARLMQTHQAIWLTAGLNSDDERIHDMGLVRLPVALNTLPLAQFRIITLTGTQPSIALAGFLGQIQQTILQDASQET